jgi:radical SAM superfamily enzyme YgiQ (UPF0313 family)
MDAGYATRVFLALEGAGKRWAAIVTLASTRNERLLAAAARAGCSCLFLGRESFSTVSLRVANKAFNVVESYDEGIARIHRHNITVQAGIVFGFDGDDESTFEATLGLPEIGGVSFAVNKVPRGWSTRCSGHYQSLPARRLRL